MENVLDSNERETATDCFVIVAMDCGVCVCDPHGKHERETRSGQARER